jgi:hypothetical protein
VLGVASNVHAKLKAVNQQHEALFGELKYYIVLARLQPQLRPK